MPPTSHLSRQARPSLEKLEGRLLPADLLGSRLVLPFEYSASTRRDQDGSSWQETLSTTRVSAVISAVLADVASRYAIPGLSAAVILGDEVLTGVAGVRQAGTTTPVMPGDTFHIGSTTKAMTATLAAVLIDRGVIRWNTTIGAVFPELRGKIQPQFIHTTLEQLLQHRSGLIGDDDASESLGEKVLSYNGDPAKGRFILLPDILKEPPVGPVGTFRYSNAGLIVTATMLQRVTGMSYERLMSRFVFGPLGMTSATFEPPPGVSGPPRQPTGHDPDGNPILPGTPMYALYDNPLFNPAGLNLRMSVGDWAKFIRVHLGERVNGIHLLRSQTLARLHTPAFGSFPDAPAGFNYAAGWVTRPAEWLGRNSFLGPSLWHNGSNGLWLADVEVFPQAKFAILVMANTTHDAQGNDLGDTAFAEIHDRLMSYFAPRLARVRSNILGQK